MAKDGGDLLSEEVQITLRFLDPNGVPYFNEETFDIFELRGKFLFSFLL